MPVSKESKEMTNNVTIKLGESATAFVKRYPDTKLLRQPAGLDFYSISWNKAPRGVVTVEHGGNTVSIDEVFSLSTSEDQAEFKGEGSLGTASTPASPHRNSFPTTKPACGFTPYCGAF